MTPKAIDLIRKDAAAVLDGQADALAPLRNETLVVTGGTGFLGTWLAELVTCLNDQHGFNTKLVLISRMTDRFKSTRAHLATRKDVLLLKSDARYLGELPKDTGYLVHAAATPDNREHSTNPIEVMSVIADGTSAVLKAVDRCENFKMLLNVSSGLVYGNQPADLERVPESFGGAPPCNTASSAYATAKRYAETLATAARSQARIPVVTARPFAFIGPYQSLETPWAINNFLRDALHGREIRVFGDGQTVRSYMYPSDFAYWMLRILTGAAPGAVYNVGSPEGITLEQLAHVIAGHFKPSPEIRLRVMPENTQHSRLVPDVTAATRTLGLKQTVPLKDAIEKTVQWNRL